MKKILNRIRNSEFLTFSEVLRLKVALVTFFVTLLTLLIIPMSSINNFAIETDVIFSLALVASILITILLTILNVSRIAMHFSFYTIAALTIYFTIESNQFYGYIMFFVTLTVLIFYQDIATFLLYGGVTTAYGVYYILTRGDLILGINSIDPQISTYTYIIILAGFYSVFLIQFLISDNIYERMNNEWVRMNKVLRRYQEVSLQNLLEMIEKNDIEPLYKNIKFQSTVSELSIFINEFFEEDANNIAEVVEYYFFLHDQDVDELIDNKEASTTARKYALQLKKYLMNSNSELTSILFDFATMFKDNKPYKNNRYMYSIDDIFSDRIDKLLSLAILYKFLKSEYTQHDKWGTVSKTFTHSEITQLFQSKEFREFLSYELVNFYLDNEELFNTYL